MSDVLTRLGEGYGLRRSVIDPVTGAPVVTSAPTGEVRQRAALLPLGRDDSGALVPAVPGLIADAPASLASALTLPRDAWRGEFETTPTRMTREEGLRVAELAGTMMGGSSPFSAPKGALRAFGGAEKDDVFAALETGLADFTVPKAAADALPAAPSLTPKATRVDPSAASWDLYHGSGAGPDFARFDPYHGKQHSESGAVFFAPRAQTASDYAGPPKAGAEAGSRVFRTTIEPGRTRVFDLADLAENDAAFNTRAREILMGEAGAAHGPLFDDYLSQYRSNRARDRDIQDQVRQMGYAPSDEIGGVSFGYGHIGAAVQMAKEQGLDTAILRGLAEHGGDDQVIALTPGRVRSYYDPNQVLYSGGPGGALPALGAAYFANTNR